LRSKTKLLQFIFERDFSSKAAHRKAEEFIPVWIELARGLDYLDLSLEEYSWIPFSLTVDIWDRLGIPVLPIVIFHFAAYA